MNGYELSRKWFDWAFDNPNTIKPCHSAMYFWIIDSCNRFGWKKKFGIPTYHSMEALGIKSKATYYSCLNDLVDWGFIEMVEKARNQNSSNIISIRAASKNESAGMSALDSANVQQMLQQTNSTCVGTVPIDKQVNKEPIKQVTKVKKTIDSDVIAFRNSLAPFVSIYGKDMVRSFYEYWSEPNKSRSKLRFQIEKTWSLEHRIKRWSSNDNRFTKSSEIKPISISTPKLL